MSDDERKFPNTKLIKKKQIISYEEQKENNQTISENSDKSSNSYCSISPIKKSKFLHTIKTSKINIGNEGKVREYQKDLKKNPTKKNIMTKLYDQNMTNYSNYYKTSYINDNGYLDISNPGFNVNFNNTESENLKHYKLTLASDNMNTTSSNNNNFFGGKVVKAKKITFTDDKYEIDEIRESDIDHGEYEYEFYRLNKEKNNTNSKNKFFFRKEKDIFEELREDLYYNPNNLTNSNTKNKEKEKEIKIKKINFKNLQNSSNKKSNKKPKICLNFTENSNYNSFYNIFSHVGSNKLNLNKINNEKVRSNFDPYYTYNTSERSNSKKQNKDYNFTNFFLSPKNKQQIKEKESITTINFSNKLISNKHKKTDEIKKKEINKIKFSYFSEFASLKKIDSLKMRNNYKSIEPISLEFKDSNKNKYGKPQFKFMNSNFNFLNLNYNNYNSDSNNYFTNNSTSNNMKKFENFIETKKSTYKKMHTKSNNCIDNLLNQNTLNNNFNNNLVNTYTQKNISKSIANANNNVSVNMNSLNLPKLNVSTKQYINENIENNQKYQQAFIQGLRNYDVEKLKDRNKFTNKIPEKIPSSNNNKNKKFNFDNLNIINNEYINSLNHHNEEGKHVRHSTIPNNYLIRRFLGNSDNGDNNKNILDSSGFCITKIKKIDKSKN